MKLIGVGRNYEDHARELNHEKPQQPIIFLMPDSAILRNNNPFYYPEYSKEIHHEVELVIKINKLGKNIAAKFAKKYYDDIAIGLDLTARDLQREAKEKRMPWTIAKGFDGSCPISKFIPKNEFKDINQLDFKLEVNGEIKQMNNTSNMLFSFDEVISYISRYLTLKKGDLIFTGTPAGVGPIHIGDQLDAFIENRKLLSCEVK